VFSMIFRAFIPPTVRTNQAISRSQIADLEGNVADLSAQLHTANAGDSLRATRGSLSPHARQSGRERAEAATAASQAREAKSLEKMASVKNDKAQLKVGLAHVCLTASQRTPCTAFQHTHISFLLLLHPSPDSRPPFSFTFEPSKSVCAATGVRRVRRTMERTADVKNSNARSGTRM
jgi:hypothetical protein